jgi:CTP:molybdopterin cytidylyltransferase MocA
VRAPAILLLAAGASSRMRGADKLLKTVGGRPLLARMAERALATGHPVFVTLPEGGGPRRAALEGLNVTPVAVADAECGMSASIRAGIGAVAPDTPAALIMLADMPEITTADLDALLAASARAGHGRIIRATGEDGTPGHPVLFPARLFPALKALQGDRGARTLVKREEPVLVPLPGRHALTDLDTPEDWQAWQG